MPYGAAVAETLVWAWSPFIGAAIPRTGLIEFNVTNEVWAIRNLQIALTFSVRGRESVFDVDHFVERYRKGSVRIPIANGHHYILRRSGGWEGVLVGIDVQATDLAGDVVSGHSP